MSLYGSATEVVEAAGVGAGHPHADVAAAGRIGPCTRVARRQQNAILIHTNLPIRQRLRAQAIPGRKCGRDIRAALDPTLAGREGPYLHTIIRWAVPDLDHPPRIRPIALGLENQIDLGAAG